MPEAHPAYTAPVTVPDRQWFEIARTSGEVYFPPYITFEQAAYVFWKCPDDWAGFSRCRLWLRGAATDATVPIIVTINAATCNELYTTHNELQSPNVALVIDEYECVDLLSIFSTVFAQIDDCDIVQFEITNNDDATALYVVGIEIVEA